MAKVKAAIASPDSFWKFITSPETSYFDREAAIEQGWRLLSGDWIPELLRTQIELQKEWGLHQFGVGMSRLSAYGGLNNPRQRVGAAINRTILGHNFTVPARMIDCPETPEARALTPWPYQLYSLIGGPNGGPNGLYNRVIRNTAAADLDQIVLSLPCGDYVSAFALIQITLDIARRSHHVRPEIFATWLNALHNPNGTLGVERATIGIMSSAAQSIAPTKADESWANLQILGLEAIDTKDSTQTVPVISGIRYILPLPNTLVLAAARYLEQAGDLHSSWRALQAKTLLEAVSPGTSAPGSSSGPVSDESQIAAFNSWFSQNRIALEERADAERDIIASARDRLKRTSGACRP